MSVKVAFAGDPTSKARKKLYIMVEIEYSLHCGSTLYCPMGPAKLPVHIGKLAIKIGKLPILVSVPIPECPLLSYRFWQSAGKHWHTASKGFAHLNPPCIQINIAVKNILVHFFFLAFKGQLAATKTKNHIEVNPKAPRLWVQQLTSVGLSGLPTLQLSLKHLHL